MIEQPWNDERLKINGRFVGCVTKANADKVMALQRDAARYRWLKDNHLQTGPDSWIRTGDDLEEAIDAAMMPNN